MTSTSESTKQALGFALKDQLETRQLDKVTVAALTKSAGITRQAFYYHFSDVYELAVWVFETDIARHIMAHASYREWANGFTTMLVYMQDHHEQVYATVRSVSSRKLERFFYETLHAMMEAIVSELEGDRQISVENREFVIDHFTLTVLGHFLHWLAGGMVTEPHQLVGKLSAIMQGNVMLALDRFSDGAGS